MSELIISVSGLRGIVGETLTPPVAIDFCAAFAAGLDEGPIVITRDGRATGAMLAGAIRGGLCAVGRDVIDAGIAATPTTGVLVRQLHAAGGIQISASHNPPEYNGIKLFAPDGRVLPARLGEKVLQRYRDQQPAWQGHDQIGSVSPCTDPISEHLQRVLATVDVERIRARQFPVLLDSNHGAGSVLGRPLLEALGCRVTFLGDVPDGQFSHVPEPTAENLRAVSADVLASHSVVGFCQDPDADRLALIDEQGRYVGEEYTLAVCLDHVLRRRSGTVVTNCATSRMSQDIAERHGGRFFRAAVGEANVVDVMQEQDAVFGGEGNGGPIDPRVGYVRDSFVGMALVLDAMAARQLPLSELADELPRYEIHKTKIPLQRDKIRPALAALEKHFRDAEADHADGLRLDWPNKWLLVRASNTEPIVRAIAEAQTRQEAEQLCAVAADVLAKT